MDGVDFNLGSNDEKSQTIINFNTWAKNNKKDHTYLKTQTSMRSAEIDQIVLIDRDQTLPILDNIFFKSEDHIFFKELSKGLEEFRFLRLSFRFSNEDEEKKQNSFRSCIVNILKYVEEKITLQRYKGLGEMNPDQLWETTLDQNERVLLAVKINEVDAANKAFEDLMGGETDARKRFIAENSLKVANLDI
jgi:DNA gyrase/topoisomerase IV subunit B